VKEQYRGSRRRYALSARYSREAWFTDNRFTTSPVHATPARRGTPGRGLAGEGGEEVRDGSLREKTGLLTFRWRWSYFETSTSATFRSRCHSGTGSSPSSVVAFEERVLRSVRRRLHRRRRRPTSRRHSLRRNYNEKDKLSFRGQTANLLRETEMSPLSRRDDGDYLLPMRYKGERDGGMNFWNLRTGKNLGFSSRKHGREKSSRADAVLSRGSAYTWEFLEVAF
jgi:hypothetical protein